jgi:hypothetical protein
VSREGRRSAAQVRVGHGIFLACRSASDTNATRKLRHVMLEAVTTFVVESPLPTTSASVVSSLVWVPVAVIVAGLLWVGWKQRRKTTD